MSAPSLEALFERYRRAGDLAAMAEVFDRSAPGLLALAAHLVRDPVEAEDLVQGTFLVALENARLFDPARRLEPWLAGILVRQALRVRRERARRADPARLERPPVAEPPALLAQHELAAALAGALDGLAEPYRGVLARHLGGERALDIARSSGRAPGTVRMQILRGLERLRRVLPAGLYGAVPLARVPRGLDALRAQVLSHGGAVPGASPAAAASVLGGLAVSTKLVLGGAAAVALILVWLARAARESEPEAAPLAQRTQEPAAPADGARLAGPVELLEVPTDPARSPLASKELAATPERESLPPRDGGAAAGVFVTGALLGLEGLDPEQVEIHVTTRHDEGTAGAGARDGRYAIEVGELLDSQLGAPPALYVTAVHPAGRKDSRELLVPYEARAASRAQRTEIDLDLDLSARTTIVGRVCACPGIWPETLHVALVGEGEVLEEVECDADGAFTLHPDAGGAYELVARAGQVPPVSRRVRVGQDELVDAGVLELEPGGLAIEGVVRVPFEARVERWKVRASRGVSGAADLLWQGIALREGRLEVLESSARPEPDGRFRITGLAPGSYALALVQDGGPEILVPGHEPVVSAPATGVVLGASHGRTWVTVSAPVEVASEATLAVRLERGLIRRDVARGATVAVLADQRDALFLEAAAPGFAPAVRELPALSRALEERVELVLVPDAALASLELEWSVPAGFAAPDQVTAHWTRAGEQGEASARAGPEGCRFEGWAAGSYRVVLEPRGADFWELATSPLCTPALELELVAGRTTRARVAWVLGGSARFAPAAHGARLEEFPTAVVRDAAGRALDVRFQQREYDEGTLAIGSYAGALPLRGQSELVPTVPPGSYELVLTLDGEPLRVPFAVVAGQTVDVPFVVP